MAEETAPTKGTEETNGQSTEPAKEFQAITSQEDFDKAIQARIARERAKIPTDYEELKAKAERFEQWENDQKTEAQRVQERLDAAEKRAAELELKAVRAEVAAGKGVPAELLTGSTQEELEASADALIAFKGQQQSLHIPNISKVPTGSTGVESDRAFADFLTGRTN